MLKADPTEWLLENDNPSVRYFTLTEILGKPETDSDAMKAKNEIMKIGVVPKILIKQNNEGYWETPRGFYTAKYTGTVWQLIILAELGADGRNEHIRKACEFILENSQDRESDGFSMNTSVKTGGGRHKEVIPCLTGNMVWSLIRFGYLKDPRIQRGIIWMVTHQQFNDGIRKAPQDSAYDYGIKMKTCWGKHTCHMGVVKALKALAEIPTNSRSDGVKDMIEKGAEYMLIHHIHKRSHNLSRVSKPSWLRFGFPLMYHTDALEVLRVLTKLGYKDERMQEAVDLVVSKQDYQGRWKLESTFNGRYQTNIEQENKPSKWITLNAVRALKGFYN